MAEDEDSASRADEEQAAQELPGPMADCDLIELLASRFRITDIEGLAFTVLGALHDLRRMNEGQGPATVKTDEGWEISTIADIERLKRIESLIIQLALEITDSPFPIGKTAQARKVSRILGSYQSYLRKLQYELPSRKFPKKWRQWCIVLALALQWKAMTGEEPTAYPNSYEPRKGGGRFYEFICTICESQGIDVPSANSVRRWLEPVKYQIDQSEG